MKIIKIVALSLAVLGLLIAAYGFAKLSDYRDVDAAWQQAADRRNALMRARATSETFDEDAVDEASRVTERLSQARNQLRGRCQKTVIAGMVPLVLALILSIVGLSRRPRGWLPVTSMLCALAGGGMLGSMLSAGVF